MQTCFETGNDKLYIQSKNKIIRCPRIHYRYPDICKIGIGWYGFRSISIEYDINKMSNKIDQSLENKMKQTNKNKNKQSLQRPMRDCTKIEEMQNCTKKKTALLTDQRRMQKCNPTPNRALCDIRTSS